MGMFMTVLEYTKSYIHGKLLRVTDIIADLQMSLMIRILFMVWGFRRYSRTMIIKRLSYLPNSRFL